MLERYVVYQYNHLEAPAVTAGASAVLIGSQDGLFPEMGSAIPGEMGGLWAGGKKLCDGFYIAIDDVPLTCCDAFEQHPVSTAYHYRMQEQQMHIVRRQFIPDGVDGCVVELTIENLRSVPRVVEVSFTVRTEILTLAAALGETETELGRDVGEYDEKTQAFYARDSRNPWHVVWGADSRSRVLQADLPETVYGFGNTPGKGINGRLFYRMRLMGGAQTTMRLFIAGGYASRSKAEDALADLRERADGLYEQKQARMSERMAHTLVTLPDPQLTNCFNWAKIYTDWLTRKLPRTGCAPCRDLPDHPTLFGDGWTLVTGGLPPLSGADSAQEILRTLMRISEEARLAPGHVAQEVSPTGLVLRTGGVKESAQFVSVAAHVLKWSGDKAFAAEIMPFTGLCISYIRRATRGFAQMDAETTALVREALQAQCCILKAVGEEDAACRQDLARIPETQQAQIDPQTAPLEDAAMWHGANGHVEQMIGCLTELSGLCVPGLPGALRGRESDESILLESKAAVGFIRPLITYLFGIEPDAMEKTICFAPHTPIGWNGWKVENLCIGTANVSVYSERVSPSRARYTLSVSEPGYRVCTVENGEKVYREVDGSITLEMGD